MVKIFKFRHKPGEAYHKVLEYIDDYGKIYESERGQKYKEADPILIIIEDPVFEKPSEVLPGYFVQRWGETFVWQYALNVAECKAEPGEWEYSYGERLAEGNQVENVIAKLRKHPETRQAACVLYWPSDTVSENPPCMVMVDFKIRDGGLNTFAVFRSNDMENGWPGNYFELLTLSYRVAAELGIRVKRIRTLSISAHVYV